MASENFTNLHDLAVSKNGGKILFATDDWFAEAENMLKVEEPIWKEGLFTPCGKWMDGWETRRKRIVGHDWCIIKLGFPGQIKGVEVDTAFFTGNYVPQCSLQAAALSETDEKNIPKRTCKLGGAASQDEMAQVARLQSEKWQEIIPISKLRAGYPDTRHNIFPVENKNSWTHLRLNAFPDGGIARLRVYGTIHPDLKALPQKVKYTATFGSPRFPITDLELMPDQSVCMSDGWETARQPNRPPVIKHLDDGSGHLNLIGEEWAIFEFGCTGIMSSIDVDTSHFIGNSPLTVELQGGNSVAGIDYSKVQWEQVMAPQKVTANATQTFTELKKRGPFNILKINIVPDGGISRIRVWGKLYAVI
ncbi:hypothetical protein B566_EDAN001702 [Ephemera danica]|nr:hypothetical protein B566_EDAN001702 [Ephemera danica]